MVQGMVHLLLHQNKMSEIQIKSPAFKVIAVAKNRFEFDETLKKIQFEKMSKKAALTFPDLLSWIHALFQYLLHSGDVNIFRKNR